MIDAPEVINDANGTTRLIYTLSVSTQPTDEAKAAYQRIQEAMKPLAEDMAAIAKFSGHLCLYSMVPSPPRGLSDAELAACKQDAIARYPTNPYVESWMSGNGGENCVVVRLKGLV